MRYARDWLSPQNSIVAALEDSQRLRDLVMPGSEIQRALKEQQEHFVALSRIGDSFAGQFRQMQSIADSMRPSLVLGEGLMAYTECTANMARLVDDMCAPYESVRQLLLPNHAQIGEVIKRFSANSVAEWLSDYALDQEIGRA